MRRRGDLGAIATRTKRRYAHELYPHPEEGEVRPLAVEVPYLYARAIGFDVQGTDWMDDRTPEGYRRGGDRTRAMVDARGRALLADALLQGLAGDEAWQWAELRNSPEGVEWVWQRAHHYGVDPDKIKPCPCNVEPGQHDHVGEPEPPFGWRTVTRVDGRESDCPDCCEPIPDEAAAS